MPTFPIFINGKEVFAKTFYENLDVCYVCNRVFDFNNPVSDVFYCSNCAEGYCSSTCGRTAEELYKGSKSLMCVKCGGEFLNDRDLLTKAAKLLGYFTTSELRAVLMSKKEQ